MPDSKHNQRNGDQTNCSPADLLQISKKFVVEK
jgi:hypothetical protein